MRKLILHAVTLTVGLSLGIAVDHYELSAHHGNVHFGFGAGDKSLSASHSDTAYAPETVDLEPIRAVIREELVRALADKSDQAVIGNQSSTPVVAAPTPHQQDVSKQQQKEAMQQIDALIGGGTWGDVERAKFHNQLALLDSEHRPQAMQKLLRALNSSSLVVTTHGLPF